MNHSNVVTRIQEKTGDSTSFSDVVKSALIPIFILMVTIIVVLYIKLNLKNLIMTSIVFVCCQTFMGMKWCTWIDISHNQKEDIRE